MVEMLVVDFNYFVAVLSIETINHKVLVFEICAAAIILVVVSKAIDFDDESIGRQV